MGTRAIIIAQCAIDGKWYGEYQQFDGMPEEVGQPLLDCIKSQNHADKFIARAKDAVATCGDDDEFDTCYVVYDSLEHAEEDWWNCFYRWDGSQWIYGRPVRDGGFGEGERPLSEVMAEINAKQKR